MLDDAEWVTWSDSAIAKACGVSDRFVGELRKPIIEPFDDSPAIVGNSTNPPAKRTWCSK